MGEGVLAHSADDVGEFARLVGAGVAARDRDPAPQGAAGEVRDEPADRAQDGGLADTGRAGEEDQFALRDLEVDALDGGFTGTVVRHGHILEADHDGSLGSGATKAGSRPRRIAAAGQRGSVGATSGTTPGCRAAGFRAAASVRSAATAAPEVTTSQARTSQRSGRYRVRSAPSAEPETREGGGETGEEYRDAVRGALGGEQTVRSGAHAEQPAEGEGGGGAADGGGDLGGTAVAAGVHRGGERHRALQRVLQDRQAHVQQAPDALVRAAAQTAGGAEALDVGDEAGREGQGHDDRDAHLVQGAREGLEQAGGVGEGVRGADADEQGGQLQAVVQGEGEGLGGDLAAEADALGPGGEADFGEGEEGVRAGDG
ncbi:hypothetical protein SVIOM74S_00962 [Streptomyces violarus]